MAPQAPDAPVDPVQASAALADARDDLDQLRRLRNPKAINEDLIQYIEAVFHGYANVKLPAEADAGARAAFERDLARYRADAEKQFLRCLTLTMIVNGRNVREDVNIAAAMKLGRTPPFLDARGRKRLSGKIERAVKKHFTKVKTHEISPDVLERTFEAMARLDSQPTLIWMLNAYAHAKQRDVALLVAAHNAMKLFETVPGKLRYKIVRSFITTYGSVEMLAAQSSSHPRTLALRRFWQQVGPGAVAVVQHYAQLPKSDQGQPLVTMGELQGWFRKHRNRGKPPWTDPDDSR